MGDTPPWALLWPLVAEIATVGLVATVLAVLGIRRLLWPRYRLESATPDAGGGYRLVFAPLGRCGRRLRLGGTYRATLGDRPGTLTQCCLSGGVLTARFDAAPDERWGLREPAGGPAELEVWWRPLNS